VLDDSPIDDNTSDLPLTVGERVLHYRLINRIGGGGMGEVYLAHDENLDRLVALKTLSAKLAESSQFRQRLKTEARASARFTHKNICSIYAIEETDKGLFISMEYVQGTTLRDLVSDKPIELERICDIAKQCCDGLIAAHDEGVVHRDIKSANIMLDKYGTVKILDFGLAKITTDESATETSSVMGTYQYMSPEQITGKKTDHRSDIFSLGVVLYEVLTGRLPFDGDNVAAIAYSIVHNDPIPISQHRSDVTPEVESIVARACSKSIDRRYQTASDMRNDLGSRERVLVEPGLLFSAAKATIAVFPFRNLTRDTESGYLSEGICDDVITAISKIPQLNVASRTAVGRLLKRDMDPVEISNELNVKHFLEGSLRRQGDLIRLNTQVTRADDGFIVWSENYERKSDDLFSLQTDIATQVATALNIALADTGAPVVGKSEPANPEAYELYLRGRFHLKRRNETSLVKAVELFTEAIRLDDGFGAAYGELAVASAICNTYGFKHEVNLPGGAQVWAEKAIDLDPGSSHAHMSMFFVLRKKDLRRAISELRTATALDESNSDAYHYLAYSLKYCGHYKTAEKAEIAANRLDPFMEMSDANLCHIYFLTGQEKRLAQQLVSMKSKHSQSHVMSSTEGWLEWCRRNWEAAAGHYEMAYSKESSDSLLIDHLADCWIRTGNTDQAISILDENLSRNPDLSMLQARLGQAYLLRGENDRANEHFGLAESGFGERRATNQHLYSAHDYFQLAWLSALKRDKAATLQYLRSAIEKDYGNYAELRVRPDWDILHGDREFDALLHDLEGQKISEDTN